MVPLQPRSSADQEIGHESPHMVSCYRQMQPDMAVVKPPKFADEYPNLQDCIPKASIRSPLRLFTGVMSGHGRHTSSKLRSPLKILMVRDNVLGTSSSHEPCDVCRCVPNSCSTGTFHGMLGRGGTQACCCEKALHPDLTRQIRELLRVKYLPPITR